MPYSFAEADLKKYPALSDTVLFSHADDLSARRHDLAWGLLAKPLRESAATGVALDVCAPAAWQFEGSTSYDQSLEIIILEGQLSLGAAVLAKGDYLQIPAGKGIPAPKTSAAPTRFLMFFDKSIPLKKTGGAVPKVDRNSWLLVRFDDAPWVAGTAMADAGRDDVPLKIKHYKQDPINGSRTYLVAVSPGVKIPWEVHDIDEEAYITQGDYTLAECLPSGSIIGHYKQSGYFYRSAGIAHNGPDSGTQTGVTMLIRTPGPLKVELLSGCRFDGEKLEGT